MERKSFIANSCILLTGMPFQSLASEKLEESEKAAKLASVINYSKKEDTYKDEAFWTIIRGMFRFPTEYINLENGYFSLQPLSTLQFHQTKEQSLQHK